MIGFDDLPDELILRILSHVSTKEVWQVVRKVDRRFRCLAIQSLKDHQDVINIRLSSVDEFEQLGLGYGLRLNSKQVPGTVYGINLHRLELSWTMTDKIEGLDGCINLRELNLS